MFVLETGVCVSLHCQVFFNPLKATRLFVIVVPCGLFHHGLEPFNFLLPSSVG